MTMTRARTVADVRQILENLEPFQMYSYFEYSGDREDAPQNVTRISDTHFYLTSDGGYGHEGLVGSVDEVLATLFRDKGDSDDAFFIFADTYQNVSGDPSLKALFDYIRSLP